MKKLLLALLVLVFLAGAAVAGIGYYAYRQLRSTVVQFAELGQVPEIERRIRLQGAFVPPASGELTDTQVARFLRVQGQVRQQLGTRFAEIERKYRALSARNEAALSDLPALLAAYRDVAGAWLEAKRAQVDALNDAGFSLDEYRWVRDRAYQALGVPFVDLDVGRLIEQAQAGASSIDAARLRGALEAAGPEINRRLVAPARKQLEENLPLASFGL